MQEVSGSEGIRSNHSVLQISVNSGRGSKAKPSKGLKPPAFKEKQLQHLISLVIILFFLSLDE